MLYSEMKDIYNEPEPETADMDAEE